MVDEPQTRPSESGEGGRSSGHDDTIPASSPPGGDASELAAPSGERYRLGAELGRGGMGRVVEAFDTQLGRAVALKEVLPKAGPGIQRRFLREVQITARLEHASIVPLYDAGTTPDGRAFYVMRKVSGRPLDQLFAAASGLPERLALLPNLLAAIDAVAHAHRRGIIHRDLKPANILVGELGETVVIDWGLAKVLGDAEDSLEPRVPSAADSLQTQVGAVFGTPGFMSPEQARGDELGPRGDVFALGATLYHLLVGRPPIRGTSATEVIESTLKHAIVPVATACPAAAPALVAIVDKALRFEADERYANAGELAEDVRRFLTGQLVGAHRYTRRERLGRFARRHRGALSVAALASVAVAALAWIGVHRIVRERDLATAARHDAETRRAIAEKQGAELARRADQLVVQRARTLLESNPTAAVAALKRLSAGSPAIVEARGLARAAILRGVAWGLPSVPGLTIAFAMSHDGRRVLQSNRDGLIQILDLDTRRVISTHTHPGALMAGWILGDRQILLEQDHESPVLYDPTTGTETALATPAMRAISISDTGELAAYVGDDGTVGVLDLAARTATTIWPGRASADVRIALDGSWIAFEDTTDAKHSRLVVTDRAGHELLHREGRAQIFAASPLGKLALLSAGRVVELRPGERDAASVEVPLDKSQTQLHHLEYRGEELQIFALQQVLTWDGHRVRASEASRGGLMMGRPTGSGAMVMTEGDGRLHVVRGDLRVDLSMPGEPEAAIRIAARPGVTRFATTGKGAVYLWDVAGLLPRQVRGFEPGLFVDPHRMIDFGGVTSQWSVWDPDTDKRRPVSLGGEEGFLLDVATSDDGRVLVMMSRGDKNTAVVLGPDLTPVVKLHGVEGTMVRLVPGNAIVASPVAGKIVGQIGKAPPRELAHVEGKVIGVFDNGPLAYVALGSTGELVRGRFDGQGFARTHVELEELGLVISDHLDRIHVATGKRLLRWDANVHEVASFSTPVTSINKTAMGLVVLTESRDLYLVPDDGPPHRIVTSMTTMPEVADGGRELIGMGAAGQPELVELPSLTGWTLPRDYTGGRHFTASPDGMRVLHASANGLVLWDLPRPVADYAAWLDELTNGEEIDGGLSWPWQNAGGGP